MKARGIRSPSNLILRKRSVRRPHYRENIPIVSSTMNLSWTMCIVRGWCLSTSCMRRRLQPCPLCLGVFVPPGWRQLQQHAAWCPANRFNSAPSLRVIEASRPTRPIKCPLNVRLSDRVVNVSVPLRLMGFQQLSRTDWHDVDRSANTCTQHDVIGHQ